MKPLLVLAGLTALATATFASAAVLVDNGIPNNLDGFHSTGPYIAASSFALPGGGIVDAVSCYGVYNPLNQPGTADAFIVSVYADAAGQPGALLASRATSSLSRTDTGGSIIGLTEYQYDATFDNVYLETGSYWLAIHNSPTGTTDDWYWLTGNGTGAAAGSSNNGASWQVEPSYALAFQIGGVVPEPAIAGVLLLGTTIMASRRTRPAIAK